MLSKAARLDYVRFRNDVLRRLGKTRGAAHQLHIRAGIDHKSIYRLMNGEYLRDFDTIVSIAVFLDLDVMSYVRIKPWHEYKVDFELVREFCKLLSGNNARELAKILDIHHRTAHSILRLGKVELPVLQKIADSARIPIESFHVSWRKRWYVHHDNVAAVEKGFPTFRRSSPSLRCDRDDANVKAR